jgi:hypothetical protein
LLAQVKPEGSKDYVILPFVYNEEDIKDFNDTSDKHNIEETIFIIRRDGLYYLCETQGENYIKFASDISEVDFIVDHNRVDKLVKIQNRTKE